MGKSNKVALFKNQMIQAPANIIINTTRMVELKSVLRLVKVWLLKIQNGCQALASTILPNIIIVIHLDLALVKEQSLAQRKAQIRHLALAITICQAMSEY